MPWNALLAGYINNYLVEYLIFFLPISASTTTMESDCGLSYCALSYIPHLTSLFKKKSMHNMVKGENSVYLIYISKKLGGNGSEIGPFWSVPVSLCTRLNKPFQKTAKRSKMLRCKYFPKLNCDKD